MTDNEKTQVCERCGRIGDGTLCIACDQAIAMGKDPEPYTDERCCECRSRDEERCRLLFCTKCEKLVCETCHRSCHDCEQPDRHANWIRVCYLEDDRVRDIDAHTPCIRIHPDAPREIDRLFPDFSVPWRLNELGAGVHAYVPTFRRGEDPDCMRWVMVRVDADISCDQFGERVVESSRPHRDLRERSAKRIVEITAETPKTESAIRTYGERNLQDVRDAAQAVLDILNLTHRERNESLDEDRQVDHWLDSQLPHERLCGEFAARFLSNRRGSGWNGDFVVDLIIDLAESDHSRGSSRLHPHDFLQRSNTWVMLVEAYMHEFEPGAIR